MFGFFHSVPKHIIILVHAQNREKLNFEKRKEKKRTYTPFLGRGIFGSGWQRQNCTLESFEEVDFVEPADVARSSRARWQLATVETRFRLNGKDRTGPPSVTCACLELIPSSSAGVRAVAGAAKFISNWTDC
ncbi:hypothetical protein CPSG_01693 [Coccidioides posadasii str. Silveira]|uniref:Uncharacterized protein n=1 Tax=Coccidioides posadasii (strain RMSCC 757 / Silveira) TaxID=443226 RepID=E9CW60_COCPS|nr:hypothetical protein CPSG_01693 [Coccidioides posadasii str. Silveira]